MKKLTILLSVFFTILLDAQESEFISGSFLNETQTKEVLDFHNQARTEVGVESLEWSVELSVFAQDWADYLAFSNDCRLEHRPNTGNWSSNYGENIYKGMGDNSSDSPLLASRGWYTEKVNFKNEILNESNWYGTGHYSQMVWQKTKQIGMGMAVCQNGNVIVVANYNPPGNYMGEKAY